jgi:hypothetical protein
MEDNDDIEITGYRQGSPKPSVACSICQKILPNENALIVHCKERHAGRSAPAQSTAATAKLTGNITAFFTKAPLETRGRPRAVPSNRGRLASDLHRPASTTLPSAGTAKPVSQPPRPKSAPPKFERDNVNDPEFHDKLNSAITAWKAMTPQQQKNNMTQFCNKRGISRETFRAYVRAENPRRLGVCPGRPRLVSKEDEEFVVDVIVMNDRIASTQRDCFNPKGRRS